MKYIDVISFLNMKKMSSISTKEKKNSVRITYPSKKHSEFVFIEIQINLLRFYEIFRF